MVQLQECQHIRTPHAEKRILEANEKLDLRIKFLAPPN